MREINLTLSTSEQNNVGQIVVRQDDDGTQKFIADIIENGQPKNLAGLTVYFIAIIDGCTIARDLATIEGNSKVSYVLKSPFFQRLGRITGFFSFERGDQRESTADFFYYVNRGCCRNIRQGNYIYEFEQVGDVIGDIIGSGDLLPLMKKITEVENSDISNHEEAKKLISDVLAKLDKHIKDKNNPHNVTASQAGAYDKKQTNDLLLKNNVKSKLIFNRDKGSYLDEKETYKYELSDSQEFMGVKLIFSGYNRSDDITLPYGYRSFMFDSYDVYGGAHYLPFIGLGGDTGYKAVKITSDAVVGVAENSTDKLAYSYVLRRIVVYYRDKI